MQENNKKNNNKGQKTAQFNVVSFKKGFEAPNVPIITLTQEDKSLHFLLDTGSDDNVINQKALNNIEYQPLELKNQHQITGFGGSTMDVSACTVPLNYNDQQITDTFLITDLSESFKMFEEAHGIKLVGMIGSKSLRKYKFTLDFDKLIAYTELT